MTSELSAPSLFAGPVPDIRQHGSAAQLNVYIGGGNIVTSTITADSVRRQGLEKGRAAVPVVKARDLMLAVED